MCANPGVGKDRAVFGERDSGREETSHCSCLPPPELSCWLPSPTPSIPAPPGSSRSWAVPRRQC